MKKLNILAPVGACVMALGAGLAMAQDGPVATACKEDTEKLCAGVEHGGGKVRACLDANKDKASPACQQALASHQPGSGSGQGGRKDQKN